MRTRLAAAIAASILLVAGSAPADTASLESASASYGALLEKYVTPRGVRYAAWRTSGDDLKSGSAVLAAFRGADPVPLEPNARKALDCLWGRHYVGIHEDENVSDSRRRRGVSGNCRSFRAVNLD